VFRHLLRTTVAIVALSALGATTVASASASTTAPRIFHSKHLTRTHHSKKPHERPTQHRTQHTTTASGSVVYTENRGCTNWFWWSSLGRYAYHCDTAYYIGGEWQSTDAYYYDWTGSRTAYYGDYRCWKSNVTSDGYVIIGTPSTTVCRWV
jgi:Tfp pilus assembly protein PilV